MIRVLVVEDSPVVRDFLVHVLDSDASLKVVATACDGEKALAAVKECKPDVITMDIYMPVMDGFEAARRIMETQPTPIVIVSGSSRVKDVAFCFHGIEAGALAVVGRPKGIDDPEFIKTSQELIQKVKLMSEIKVVRRWPELRRKICAPPAQANEVRQGTQEIKLVAIGASTGGPIALRTILSSLPGSFPVPIVIVQHIVSGFVPGFVQWLAESASFPAQVAVDSEYLMPGNAYVAPDNFQMLVTAQNRIRLTGEYGDSTLRPSVGCLFRSVADVFGRNAIGVLLTGMGVDGARELKLMNDKQAITIAQDEESSIIHGMPGEAIKLKAATYILPLNKIASALASLTKRE